MESARCDRCQESLGRPEDLHYAISIEIEAQGFVDNSEFDSNEDQLTSLQKLIESADETCSADFGDEWYQRREYLVCKNCYNKYVRNPLGKPNR